MSEFYTEKVQEATDYLSQPNASTCQSTCIAMATGRTDIMQIREDLEFIGDPGNPATMGVLLVQTFGDRYDFDDNACLSEIREWLKAGEFLIVHGWFTGSGHVICLTGCMVDTATLSYKILVKDPWSEFDFSTWLYNNPGKTKFDGYYSAYGLYAAIVAGQSVFDAAAIYRRGELDSMRKGAWVHRIKPAKK
jgi:Papain-like cysteine protease AvrRpt2